MRILITNWSLSGRTGTELFVRDLALFLRDQGQVPEVYSPRLGLLAEKLKEEGVSIRNFPSGGSRPDVIHGQHHLSCMAALVAWPGVPAVYHVHGFRPWEERPPRHPRILRYVATSAKLLPWLESECGIGPSCVEVVPNFFSPKQFDSVRTPPASPRRALIFSNHTAPGQSHETLRLACGKMGVELDAAGHHFGNSIDTPEKTLPLYDIVFATGRCALEAMACGCAVICQSDERCGSMVLPDNFEALREKNFAIPVGTPPFSEKDVLGHLSCYDAACVAEVSRRVRAECDGRQALETLLALYREVGGVGFNHTSDDVDVCEREALTHYMVELDRYLHHGDRHFARLREGWEKTKEQLARTKQRLEDRNAERGLGPRFWSKMRNIRG